MSGTIIDRLIASVSSPRPAVLARTLRIPAVLREDVDAVSRAQIAMALNIILFADLLTRVPSADAYVAGVAAKGGRIVFDHGALRTIAGTTEALPPGYAAFARLLEPLGYEVAGIYPLPRLRMIGRAFAHRDLPADIPQFFVSELHVDELEAEARAAAGRVFGDTRDPIGPAGGALLDRLADFGSCDLDTALAGLPELADAFARHHPEPSLADITCCSRIRRRRRGSRPKAMPSTTPPIASPMWSRWPTTFGRRALR